DPVLWLCLPVFPPDREPLRALPRALAGALPRADGDPHALRGRRPRARAPLRVRGAVLRPHSRAEDGDPLGPAQRAGLAGLRDPDPVVFFEAKALYHAAKEEVPEESETLPLGRAQAVREGNALTLIAYGAMVRVALEAADVLQEEDGVEATVIDLLTIAPLDRETLVNSVKQTGRAVVVHEAPRSFGPGAEIAASIMDGAFLSLEAPI